MLFSACHGGPFPLSIYFRHLFSILRIPCRFKCPDPFRSDWCGFDLGITRAAMERQQFEWRDSVLTKHLPPGPHSFGAASAAGGSRNVFCGFSTVFGIQRWRYKSGYNWQVSGCLGSSGLEMIIVIPTVRGLGSGTLTNFRGPFPFVRAPEVVKTSHGQHSKPLTISARFSGAARYLTPNCLLLWQWSGLAYGGQASTARLAQSNNDVLLQAWPPAQHSEAVRFPGRARMDGSGVGLEWMLCEVEREG